MNIVALLLTIALIGLVVYAIVTFIPMPAQFRQIIVILAIVLVVLWLLSLFGVVPSLGNIRVGRS